MPIFVCGNCSKEYNDINRKPLSLPCGHVFCEECICSFKVNINSNTYKGVTCPSDNIFHKINIKKIPVCAQIFANLPKKHSPCVDSKEKRNDTLFCVRHPNKKIKFFCKTHFVFPCSICVVEHTNDNIIPIKLSYQNMENEIKELQNVLDVEQEKFLIQKGKVEENEIKVTEHYTAQIKTIESYYQKIVNNIIVRKNMLISKISSLLSEQNQWFKELKGMHLTITDSFIELSNQISIMNRDIIPKGEYETFYKKKMKILSDIKKVVSSYRKYDTEPKRLFQFVYNPKALSTYDNKELFGSVDCDIVNNYNIKIDKSNDIAVDSSNESFLSNFNNNACNIFQQNLLSGNRMSQDENIDYGRQRLNTSSNKNNQKRKPQSTRDLGNLSSKMNKKFLTPTKKIYKENTNPVVLTSEQGGINSNPSTGFTSNNSRNPTFKNSGSNKPKILTKNYSSYTNKNNYIKTENSVEKQHHHFYQKQYSEEHKPKSGKSQGKEKNKYNKVKTQIDDILNESM